MIRVTENCAHGATVVRADSPADLAADCRAGRGNFAQCDKHWTGRTWVEALRDAERGETNLVAKAEELVGQLECSVDAPRSFWERTRAGAYPVVPDFLMGHPDCMRRRVMVPDDRSPLRVVVDLTSSAAISRQDLERRGVAYLALAMFLANERAVTLEVVSALGSHGRNANACLVVTPIPAAPLDLAVACSALTSAGFSRGLGYSTAFYYAEKVGRPVTGAWAWGMQPVNNEVFNRRMREALGLGPDDVFAPPAHCHDPAIKDPVAFVRRAIEEHSRRRDE